MTAKKYKLLAYKFAVTAPSLKIWYISGKYDFRTIFTPIVIRAKPSRQRPFYPQDQAGVAIKEANLVAISPRLSLLSTKRKLIHPKYYKHWLSTQLWHTQLILYALAYFDPKTTLK